MADLGLAGHEQRVGQEGPGVLRSAAVDRDLRAAQQRQRLAGDGADPAVQPGALGEVAVGLVEPPGEDPGLAAQRERERVAARGADALRLGREAVGERDDLVVGQPAVEHPLGDAQLPVEDARGELRQIVGGAQVLAQPGGQLALGVRRQRVRPRRVEDRAGVAELAPRAGAPRRPSPRRCRRRRSARSPRRR